MKLDRGALPLAAGFFLVWLCVLYMGADHPPPRGFGWLVPLDLVAALLVYPRVPTYPIAALLDPPTRLPWVM